MPETSSGSVFFLFQMRMNAPVEPIRVPVLVFPDVLPPVETLMGHSCVPVLQDLFWMWIELLVLVSPICSSIELFVL